MTRIIGYIRVSTQEQADNGAGIDAQRHAIESECERRGWELVAIYDDPAMSGALPWQDRPGLAAAVTRIEAKGADALMCSKLDRLSRSLLDFATILERSRRKRWAIILLDFGLDMTTPVGEMVASILAAVAQFERARIGQRTSEALQRKRAQGIHIGRRSTLPAEVIQYIVEAREAGLSYQIIADALNADGVPTGQGGQLWRRNAVREVVVRQSR